MDSCNSNTAIEIHNGVLSDCSGKIYNLLEQESKNVDALRKSSSNNRLGIDQTSWYNNLGSNKQLQASHLYDDQSNHTRNGNVTSNPSATNESQATQPNQSAKSHRINRTQLQEYTQDSSQNQHIASQWPNAEIQHDNQARSQILNRQLQNNQPEKYALDQQINGIDQQIEQISLKDAKKEIDVTAVHCGDKILIKNLIQDAGKINISNHHTLQENPIEGSSNQFIQDIPVQNHGVDNLNQEFQLGGRANHRNDNTDLDMSKSQYKWLMGRSNSSEAIKTSSTSRINNPYSQSNQNVAPPKIVQSFDDQNQRETLKTSSVDCKQIDNNYQTIQNEHYMDHNQEDASNNLNARCNSFENKYRILRYQSINQGQVVSRKENCQPYQLASKGEFGVMDQNLQKMKPSFEGIRFKSEFAKRMYNSNVQKAQQQSQTDLMQARKSQIICNQALYDSCKSHAERPILQHYQNPNTISYNDYSQKETQPIISCADASRPYFQIQSKYTDNQTWVYENKPAMLIDKAHYKEASFKIEKREDSDQSTKINQIQNHNQPNNQYCQNNNVDQYQFDKIQSVKHILQPQKIFDGYHSTMAESKCKINIYDSLRTSCDVMQLDAAGSDKQTRKPRMHTDRDQITDLTSNTVAIEIQGRNRKLKQMQSDYMKKSREFSAEPESKTQLNLTSSKVSSQNQSNTFAPKDHQKKSKKSQHQAKISLANLQKQFYQQKIEEMVQPRSQSKQAVVRSLNYQSEHKSAKDSKPADLTQKSETANDEGYQGSCALRNWSNKNREFSEAILSARDQKRSHSYNKQLNQQCQNQVQEIKLDNQKLKIVKNERTSFENEFVQNPKAEMSDSQHSSDKGCANNKADQYLFCKDKIGHSKYEADFKKESKIKNYGKAQSYIDDQEDIMSLKRALDSKKNENKIEQPRRFKVASPTKELNSQQRSPTTDKELKGILKNSGGIDKQHKRKKSSQIEPRVTNHDSKTGSPLIDVIIPSHQHVLSNQLSGLHSRTNSYCLNQDLTKFQQVADHPNYQNQPYLEQSNQLSHLEQRQIGQLDGNMVGMTVSSSYISPGQPRLYGSHAPIPYLSSNNPTQRDGEDDQSSNKEYQNCKTHGSHHVTAAASQSYLHLLGFNQQNRSTEPNTLQCHNCTQINLKVKALEDKITKLEAENGQLAIDLSLAQAENNQKAEKIKEKSDEVEQLSQQNQQISQQLLQQSEIKKVVQNYDQRCQKAQEVLRKETSNSEKQRAEIQILRQAIEVELKKFGISFKQTKSAHNQSDKASKDGYLLLIQQQQQIDQLKDKISNLIEQQSLLESKNEKAVNQLKDSKLKEVELLKTHYVEQIVQANDFITELKQDKAFLLKDKEHLQNVIVQSNSRLKQLEHLNKQPSSVQQVDSNQISKLNKSEKEVTHKNTDIEAQSEDSKNVDCFYDQEIQRLNQILKEKINEVQTANLIKIEKDTKIAYLNQQVDQLNQQTEKLNQQLVQKQAECGSLIEVNEEMQQQIKKREAQIQQLSNQIIPELTSKQQELIRLNQDNQTKLQAAEQQIQQKQNALDSYHQDQNHAAEAHQLKLLAQIDSLQQQYTDSLQTQNALQEEITQSKQLLEQTELNYKQAESKLQSNINDQNGQIKQLNDKLLQANCLNEQLDRQTQMKDQEIKTNISVFQAIQQENSKLQTDLETATQQFKQLQSEHNAKIADLEQQLKDTQAQKSELQIELEQQSLDHLKSKQTSDSPDILVSNQPEQVDGQQSDYQMTNHNQDQTLLIKISNKSEEQLNDKNQRGLLVSNKLSQIIQNMNYFCESIKSINDLNQKYPLLSQLLTYNSSLKSSMQNRDTENGKQGNDEQLMFNILDNCLNCVFQTIFNLVLINEQNQQLIQQLQPKRTSSNELLDQLPLETDNKLSSIITSKYSASIEQFIALAQIAAKNQPQQTRNIISSSCDLIKQQLDLQCQQVQSIKHKADFQNQMESLIEVQNQNQTEFNKAIKLLFNQISVALKPKHEGQPESNQVLKQETDQLIDQLNRIKDTNPKQTTQVNQINQYLRSISSHEYSLSIDNAQQDQNNQIFMKNVKDQSSKQNESRGEFKERELQYKIKITQLQNELDQRRFCQKCGSLFQKSAGNSRNNAEGVPSLMVSPLQASKSSYLQSSCHKTPDFIVGSFSGEVQLRNETKNTEMSLQNNLGFTNSIEIFKSDQSKLNQLVNINNLNLEPVNQQAETIKCVELDNNNQANAQITGNFTDDTDTQTLQQLMNQNNLFGIQSILQRDSLEKNRSISLIKKSNQIISNSRRSMQSKEGPSNESQSKLQKEKNQTSIASLVETHNNSNHLKSSHDESARQVPPHIDRLLPQNTNILINSSQSSEQLNNHSIDFPQDGIQLHSKQQSPVIIKDQGIKIIDTSAKSSIQNAQSSILEEQSYPSQASDFIQQPIYQEPSKQKQQLMGYNQIQSDQAIPVKTAELSPLDQKPKSQNNLDGICFKNDDMTEQDRNDHPHPMQIIQREVEPTAFGEAADSLTNYVMPLGQTIFSQQIDDDQTNQESSNRQTSRTQSNNNQTDGTLVIHNQRPQGIRSNIIKESTQKETQNEPMKSEQLPDNQIPQMIDHRVNQLAINNNYLNYAMRRVQQQQMNTEDLTQTQFYLGAKENNVTSQNCSDQALKELPLAGPQSPSDDSQKSKRVIGNIKLANLEFKVSQKFKDKSAIDSHSNIQPQKYHKNQAKNELNNDSQISGLMSSSQTDQTKQKYSFDTSKAPRVGTIHRIKLKKNCSISGDDFSKSSQTNTPDQSKNTQAVNGKNECVKSEQQFILMKIQSKDSDANNQVSEETDHQRQALKNQANIKHQFSKLQNQISVQKQHGSTVISNQTNEAQEIDQKLFEVAVYNQLGRLSRQQTQNSNSIQFAPETPDLARKLIDSAHLSKFDNQEDEQSRENSFHKEFELVFNQEKNSPSVYSSQQRSKKGLSDSQVSFQKQAMLATPNGQDDAEKSNSVIQSWVLRSNSDQMGNSQTPNGRKIELVLQNDTIKEQNVESDRTGCGQSEDKHKIVNSGYGDKSFQQLSDQNHQESSYH